MVNWIMACVCNVNFDISVNGLPTGFFSESKGTPSGLSTFPSLIHNCH